MKAEYNYYDFRHEFSGHWSGHFGRVPIEVSRHRNSAKDFSRKGSGSIIRFLREHSQTIEAGPNQPQPVNVIWPSNGRSPIF